MDCFYSRKGFLDISPLPVVSREYDVVTGTKQVPHYRYAAGGMTEAPVERGNKNSLLRVNSQYFLFLLYHPGGYGKANLADYEAHQGE